MRTTLLKLTALPRVGEVQAARARVASARTRLARTRLGNCALEVEAQTHAHPLACVGVAVGAGWTLGWLGVRPWPALDMGRLVSRHVLPWSAQLLAMARNPGSA